MDNKAEAIIVAEQLLLGRLLADNTTIDTISMKLGAQNFSIPRHRVIYKHIIALNCVGINANAQTIEKSINSIRIFKAIGGKDYIKSMQSVPCAKENLLHYANMIIKCKQERLKERNFHGHI